MKNRFLFRPILCALLGLLALTACRPELDYVVDSFRSSQATLSGGGETITVLFNSEAGTASIDLSASGKWTAEFVNGRAYWCTLSQTEGKRGLATLTFSVQANGEYDERSASVVFTSGDLKRTVVVVQKQRDAMLVSSGRFDIAAEGGTVTIEVSSNVDFTHAVAADAGDWIHSLSTKGLRQTGVVFRIDANPMLTRRSGTITFNGAGGSEIVTVYQKGEIPTIVVSEEEVALSAEEGVFRVEIASNLDVTYEIPADCDWVRELVTKTVSTRTYMFAYDRNHTRKPRTCPIVFRNEEYEKAETVSVVQNPAEIVRDAQLILCPSTGDTFSILTHGAVAGFDQFRFDTDWPEAVSVTPEGDGNRFVVKVAPNPDTYARQTTCLVYRPGFEEPDRVNFLQFGQLPSFSYVTSQREVVAPVLLGLNGDAFVIWGDGTYEVYEEGLTHQYQDAGPHTIRIEGDPLPFVLIGNPQNGMRYDLRNLNVL